LLICDMGIPATSFQKEEVEATQHLYKRAECPRAWFKGLDDRIPVIL